MADATHSFEVQQGQVDELVLLQALGQQPGVGHHHGAGLYQDWFDEWWTGFAICCVVQDENLSVCDGLHFPGAVHHHHQPERWCCWAAPSCAALTFHSTVGYILVHP
jgi:hypothetical protein